MNQGNRVDPERLKEELQRDYGAYVPLSRCYRMLSYPSVDAARKAYSRGTAVVSGASLPGRRGTFIRTTDIIAWLEKGLESTSAPQGS